MTDSIAAVVAAAQLQLLQLLVTRLKVRYQHGAADAARRGDGAAPALRDKRVYAEVYAKSKAWACDQLRKGTTRGLVMGLEGKIWTGLVRRVGAGMELKTDGEDVPERQDTTTPTQTPPKAQS